MGKKSSKKKLKNKVADQQKSSVEKIKPVQKKATLSASKALSNKMLWGLTLFIALVAFTLNTNTFNHRFVLDDHGIIKNNKITKAPVSLENTKLIFTTSLRKGDFSDLENTLYRPFTKLLFNIEWNAFSGNAHHFHKVNVLLYAILCGLIFLVLYDLLKKKWVVPFLATLLFAVHAVHTEVVANVKSGDEILGLLGIVLALRCIQLYLGKKNIMFLLLASLSFLAGLYSKESSVVAVGIFPFFVYYMSDQLDWKKIGIVSSTMLACALVFIYSRHVVLGQYPPANPTSAMDNFLVLCESGTQQFASAVMVVGYYLYTFLVPHPLSCDYSYSTFVPSDVSNPIFLLTFLLCLGAFIYAIKELKNKSIIGFGILWFFISFSLASNVFFLIGTGFGERLLFMPSMGLCLVFVGLLAKFFKKSTTSSSILDHVKASPVLWAVVLIVSILYAGKTMSRNQDWRTDYQLFSTDIESYPDATHLLFYMGNHLSGDERKEVLTEELSSIGFNQQQITDSIAKESATSINYFRRSLSIYPALPSDGYNQLGKAYFKTGQLDSAFKYYKQALDLDTTNGIFVNNVGTIYYQKQDLNTAMPYFQKAHSLDTAEADFMNNMGAVFGQSGMYDSAIYWFYKASVADSLDLTSVKFLEMTYQNLGNAEQAKIWGQRKNYVANRRKQLLK